MAKRGGSSPGPLERATSIVLAALTTEVILLAMTGVALYFIYRPTDAQTWDDLWADAGSGPVAVPHAVRLLHRLVAYLALLTAPVAAVLVALRSPGTRRWTGPLLGIGLVVTAAAGVSTGYLLPWDQLALWAVVVGRNMTGYGPILEDEVRFAIIGGVEVSPEAVMSLLALHSALGGPAAGLLLADAWRRHRRGRRRGERERPAAGVERAGASS